MKTEAPGGCVTCPGSCSLWSPYSIPSYVSSQNITHCLLSHSIPSTSPRRWCHRTIGFRPNSLRGITPGAHADKTHSAGMGHSPVSGGHHLRAGLSAQLSQKLCVLSKPSEVGLDGGANDRWMKIRTWTGALQADPRPPVFTGPQMKSPGCL